MARNRRIAVLFAVLGALLAGCSVSIGTNKPASAKQSETRTSAASSDPHAAYVARQQARQKAEQDRWAAQEAAKKEQEQKTAQEAEEAEFERQLAEQQEQAELERQRTAVPEAVGLFAWSEASYGSGEGCEMWSSQRLRVRVTDNGTVTWNGFRSGDGACGGRPMVATNCGASGEGFLTRREGQLFLVTTSRGGYGGLGADPKVSVWQCGALKVRAPLTWEPAKRNACVRLGTEEDKAEATASAAACVHAPPFPELGQEGVPVDVGSAELTLELEKRKVPLKKTE